MKNYYKYILITICCILLNSCSLRLVHPVSGPCYYDFLPLIHLRSEYDISGNILDKSIIRDSIKFGKPTETFCKESNYILGSRQGTALVYCDGKINFVHKYKLYINGKPIRGKCIKVKIGDEYIFINIRTKRIIHSYPKNFKFSDKYVMLFYKLRTGTYYLRISNKANNWSPYFITVSPGNVKSEVVVEFEK